MILFSSTSRVGANIGFQAPVRQMMLPHEESIHVECVRYRYYEINWSHFISILNDINIDNLRYVTDRVSNNIIFFVSQSFNY